MHTKLYGLSAALVCFFYFIVYILRAHLVKFIYLRLTSVLCANNFCNDVCQNEYFLERFHFGHDFE